MIKDRISLSLNLTELNHNILMEIDYHVNEIGLSGTVCDTPAWNKGLTLSPRDEKTKKKISDTLTGNSLSEERKNNISVSVKKLYENGSDLGFRKNASEAGRVGGKSKSAEKLNSIRKNQIKSLDAVRGSVWMYNKDTKKRQRVRGDSIETKLSEGWIFGMATAKTQ